MGIGIHRWRDLFGPLSLAAYVAWFAVWLTLGTPRPLLAGSGLLSPLAMLLFLAAFTLEQLLPKQGARRSFLLLAAVMAAAALLVIALHPTSGAPILLVLLAGMLGAQLQGWTLFLPLMLVSLGMAAILLGTTAASTRYVLVTVTAYASFQAFAAVVLSYARRAEEATEQLRASHAELMATRSLLAASSRDQERLRLSRELHDVAGHSLTALKLNLGALARDPRQPDPERTALCAGLANDLLQNLRRVVASMRTQDGMDLREAIEHLAAPYPTPRLHLEIADDAQVDDLERAEAILRTVQEGLTNAARHSGAANLWVVLQRDGDRLRLELRDDGRGAVMLAPGNGLAGMRERLQAAGGGLDIEARAASGLCLHAWLPAHASRAGIDA
jgi:signal transduction histidine kinase